MYYIIYQIVNNINGKRYIGAHQTKNLDDGYMGSGIGIKRAIDKYGKENFTKEILYFCDGIDEMYEVELYLVNEDIVSDSNYYNMTIGGRGGFHHINSVPRENPMHNKHIVENVRNALIKTRNSNKEYYDKISIKNLELATKSNIGRKHSKETINKRVDSLKKYYESHDHVSKGKPMKESHRDKISESWTDERKRQQSDRMKERIANGLDMGTNRGKKFSEKTKELMSIAAKNRKKRIVVCPHCNKEGGERGMKRWHFDKCKNKR